jgi:hypothetical protein
MLNALGSISGLARSRMMRSSTSSSLFTDSVNRTCIIASIIIIIIIIIVLSFLFHLFHAERRQSYGRANKHDQTRAEQQREFQAIEAIMSSWHESKHRKKLNIAQRTNLHDMLIISARL